MFSPKGRRPIKSKRHRRSRFSTEGGGHCVHMDKSKTFDVGLVLLMHAQNVEEVQSTLNDCIRYDLRVEGKEVGYCEEHVGSYTFN
jgi:hypothetical protein